MLLCLRYGADLDAPTTLPLLSDASDLSSSWEGYTALHCLVRNRLLNALCEMAHSGYLEGGRPVVKVG